jgi:hypothetical protein
MAEITFAPEQMPVSSRKLSRFSDAKQSESMPVGPALIGVVAPRSTRKCSILRLGAITWSHKLQYSVANWIATRFSNAESNGF